MAPLEELNPDMSAKPFRKFCSFLNFNRQLGFALIFLWGIPRFIIVLQANVTGNYQYVSIIFVLMIILPFILLNRAGRTRIGLVKPKWSWLVVGMIAAIILCSMMYLLAASLYGNTTENWFVYISRSFSNIPENITTADRNIYFIIYAIISMTFSPIGEEFFYRGFVHECFAENWGNTKASIVDALAFSFTHLAHFGIVFIAGSWVFYLVPSILWVAFLFLLSLLFSWIRTQANSLWGAVVTHAGYNLAMTYFIFFHIL